MSEVMIRTDADRVKVKKELSELRDTTIPEAEKQLASLNLILKNNTSKVLPVGQLANLGTQAAAFEATLATSKARAEVLEAAIAADKKRQEEEKAAANKGKGTPPAGTPPKTNPDGTPVDNTGVDDNASSNAEDFFTQQAAGIPVWAWFVIGLLIFALIAGLIGWLIWATNKKPSSSLAEDEYDAQLYGQDQGSTPNRQFGDYYSNNDELQYYPRR